MTQPKYHDHFGDGKYTVNYDDGKKNVQEKFDTRDVAHDRCVELLTKQGRFAIILEDYA